MPKAHIKLFTDAELNERIFVGKFPAGLGYADRKVERHGDYASLAFLSYATLQLTFDKLCPAGMRNWITASAAEVQAKKGEQYQISTCGQTVTLGYELLAATKRGA